MDKEHRMLDARIMQAQGLKQREIAAQLGVTDRTVRNYLRYPPRPRKRPQRGSLLDPFKPTIREVLEKNPYSNGVLLFEHLKARGYAGRISILRDHMAQVRKQLVTTAVRRFETEPGLQAQVDWKEFGRQTVDGKEQKLYAFVMVLGYSRKVFVHFTTSMKAEVFLACHDLAFRYFGGVPKEILYDNMKTAFVYDAGKGAFQANRKLKALAVHNGFIPRRCRIRRPQTKGKVERAIGYLAANFWPRLNGLPLSLDGLNEAKSAWLDRIAEKPIRELGESRAVRFERERTALTPLPSVPFDAREVRDLVVSREATIQFETNRYSVPPHTIGGTVTLRIDPFRRNAELLYRGTSIRTIILAPPGGRRRIVLPEDRRALRERWERELVRQQARRPRKPEIRKKHPHMVPPAVEIRSPEFYESLIAAEAC
jgi:transposase